MYEEDDQVKTETFKKPGSRGVTASSSSSSFDDDDELEQAAALEDEALLIWSLEGEEVLISA